MGALRCGRRDMLLLPRRSFLRARRGRDTAGAAVITHLVDRHVVVDDSLVVRVVDNGRIDVVDGGVVRKVTAGPTSTGKAHPDVTEAVVHAAVESDMRSPIAGMKTIDAAGESPIARSPQQTDLRRLNPGSRNPEIPARAVVPVAWRPEI